MTTQPTDATWEPADKIRFINSPPQIMGGWERNLLKIMTPTPEQMRFHAAGHIAAAMLITLDEAKMEKAVTERMTAPRASQILGEVLKYVDHPTVSAPAALRDKLVACIEDPCNNLMTMAVLEKWFCDPFNTVIEKSGGKF